MSGRLEGRVAIVTGAGQGIGEAIARRFIGEGAEVVGIDFKEDTLRRVADALNKFTPFVTDIQDHAALAECVDQTIKRHGKIDILTNNAGFSYYTQFIESSLEQWRHTHRVNLEAQYALCKLVAPVMIENGYGRIVNISSTQSIAVEPLVSAYAASKSGINALTRSLAVELAEYNILANAIAPGAIHTPMSIIDGVDEIQSEYFQEWYVKNRKIPLGRAGEADEIAAAALFLASEECSYITGHVLVADGGLTITF